MEIFITVRIMECIRSLAGAPKPNSESTLPTTETRNHSFMTKKFDHEKSAVTAFGSVRVPEKLDEHV